MHCAPPTVRRASSVTCLGLWDNSSSTVRRGVLITAEYGVPAHTTATADLSTYTLHALRADDGHEILPSLSVLGDVTAWLLDHGVLYVTNIGAPAQPNRETLYAFSLQRGELLWQTMLLATTSTPRFGGVDLGALYVLLVHDQLALS
jgi:outer membrane protein assembly factor BamB